MSRTPAGNYSFTAYLGDHLVSLKADYTPGSPATRDYPGDSAELILTSVTLEGKDILPFLSEDAAEGLVIQAMDPDNWEDFE